MCMFMRVHAITMFIHIQPDQYTAETKVAVCIIVDVDFLYMLFALCWNMLCHHQHPCLCIELPYNTEQNDNDDNIQGAVKWVACLCGVSTYVCVRMFMRLWRQKKM